MFADGRVIKFFCMISKVYKSYPWIQLLHFQQVSEQAVSRIWKTLSRDEVPLHYDCLIKGQRYALLPFSCFHPKTSASILWLMAVCLWLLCRSFPQTFSCRAREIQANYNLSIPASCQSNLIVAHLPGNFSSQSTLNNSRLNFNFSIKSSGGRASIQCPGD